METFLVKFIMKGILRSREKNIISLSLYALLFDVKFVSLGEKMLHKKISYLLKINLRSFVQNKIFNVKLNKFNVKFNVDV